MSKMGRPRRDLTGEVFGKWTVLRLTDWPRRRWLCRCKCGTEREVYSNNLLNGSSGGCGVGSCLPSFIHGMAPQLRKGRWFSEYNTWAKMKARCSNPKDKWYHAYGGRGIKVCEAWINSFVQFRSDMGPKPTPKHTLERVDVNGNYTPSNCCWATQAVQSLNKRNSKKNRLAAVSA